MIPMMTPRLGAALEEVSEEVLRNDVLYYKAMLAEAARKTESRHLSPTTLRQRLQECENRLRRLRGGR